MNAANMCLQIVFLFSLIISDSFQFNQKENKINSNDSINNFRQYDVNENILEDSVLMAPQLISKYGYPVKTYSILTEDGYILEMHRIARPGAQPVFLMHGLLDSSSTWVLMGPNKGLGYILYDLGYDVWMGNARGNRYSKKHKTLSPKTYEFWNFSFHEIGKYDLPAMIDRILNETKFDKIHYIAHSQGTTVFWIMCSEEPKYNDKILLMQALGPVAYLKYVKGPIMLFFKTFLNSFNAISRLIGMNEFMPNSEIVNIFGNLFCKDQSAIQEICKNVIFLICGFNEKQLNSTMLPVILGHAPAGSSSKQIVHFVQLIRSGEFRQYDFGFIRNLVKYGSLSPPKYNLKRIKVNVALHYSLNDWLADPRDVERLHQNLPNPIGKFLIKDKNYNHLDYVWGINAKEYLYERVIKIMKYYENQKI